MHGSAYASKEAWTSRSSNIKCLKSHQAKPIFSLRVGGCRFHVFSIVLVFMVVMRLVCDLADVNH